MGEPSPGAPPPENAAAGRLDSWKAIAAYLGRDVKTVQRWEKLEGMPVHRHLHARIGSVYGFRGELDTWIQSRKLKEDPRLAGPHDSSCQAAADCAPAPAPPRQSWPPWPLMAAGAALALGAAFWFLASDFFWRNPLASARFRPITDFDGVEQAAAISRDGQFVAFLSSQGGQMDVWVTRVGSGQFHNLTNGRVPELVNPSVRTLEFSPDGSLVTFWVRTQDGRSPNGVSTWAIPTLGGQPKPYLEGTAEVAWSQDGARFVYHTASSGDPLRIQEPSGPHNEQLLFRAPDGGHNHYPAWSPDSAFIYFVHGSLPDQMDIWRIRPSGGVPERITFHNGRVSHPVLLNRRTLLYLACDADGAGPWLYGMDLRRREPHRLMSGLETYTSLAASADRRRIVLTRANPKRTLWRLPVPDSAAAPLTVSPISLKTRTGSSPRLGPDALFYVSAAGAGAALWKLAGGASVELWTAPGAQMLSGPAVSDDGQRLAFPVRQGARTLLYVTGPDGANARVVSDSLILEGAPAWAPGGKYITAAVTNGGIPHLLNIPAGGGPAVPLVNDYSVAPSWSPDGRFVIYSGPDVGATFPIRAVTASGAPYPIPPLSLNRGPRRVAFLQGGRSLVYVQGGIQSKNLWIVNLDTGAQRRWTNFPPGFTISDFDISPDRRELVLERVQEHSDVVLLDLPRP
jgi:Tol biopolymer transport system component